MPKGQLDELTDLSHLLAATTNIVVSDIVEIRLFVFALDRVALWRYASEFANQRIRQNNAHPCG